MIYKFNTRGRIITHTESLQDMLKYPGIFVELKYINISKLPLEFCAGFSTKNEK